MNEKIEEREIVLWECDPDAEILNHNTRDEAIEHFLDGQGFLQTSGTIQVNGFARMIPEQGAWAEDAVIDALLEGPWEELVDPENGPERTREMAEAAKVFVAVMVKEFHVWACEIVTTEDVDVAAWIKENRPDWLEKKDK